MGIVVRWDDKNKSVIRHVYEGNWTLEEYIEASQETYALIDEVDYEVHLLVVVTDGVRPLSDMIIAARDDRTQRHERQGKVVVVGASSFMILFTRVIAAVRPGARNVKFVSTEDEAYRILEFDTVPVKN